MKVFYDPRQCAPSSGISPSAEKPKWVMADWQSMPELSVQPMPFEPVSLGQLHAAHDPSFVDAVLDLTRDNGFGDRDAGVALALPWTSGSLLGAAKWAVANQAAAVSPTSGFHHAEWSQAMGFCTFNGLMVAALALKAQGLVRTVGILDCDAHYGNGTDDIMAKLGVDWIEHHTMGRYFQRKRDVMFGAFESWLGKAIERVAECDLILYQAGADPHELDPYGGMLSSARMSERDHRVFEALKGKALAWNLAGGYQVDEALPFPGRIEKVLELHRETARWHAKVLGA